MKQLKIRDKLINENSPVYIIAEMSASHAGSLENALELVHAAKKCGADCIKIQTYTADTLTLNCKKPDFIIHGGLWDGYDFYTLYQEAYMPWEWQGRIKDEAERIGIDFFSTPFDCTAVDFLEDIGVEFYKIASYELVDIPLIKYVASKGKPVIMSTGMATVEEIAQAVDCVRAQGNEQIALLKCSSVYPARPEGMNLITIPELSRRFDIISGFSDHSMSSLSAVASVAMGAKILEKHLCLSRDIPNNPDAGFSLEPAEFMQLVNDVRATEVAIGKTPYTYSQTELNSRTSRRSLYASADIKKGELFTPQNIRSIRPGYGLSPRYFEELIGKSAAQDVSFGMPLTLEMVEKK